MKVLLTIFKNSDIKLMHGNSTYPMDRCTLLSSSSYLSIVTCGWVVSDNGIFVVCLKNIDCKMALCDME